MVYSDESLGSLRETVKNRLSENRFLHTLGVERAAERLGKIFLPDKISELRAAALLHDIAKEIPIDVQLEMLKKANFELNDEDMMAEGVIHSFTAPIVVKNDFQKFALPYILSSVLNHTVGSKDMTVFDKIIFISDYIEDTRTYPSCIEVRETLYSLLQNALESEKIIALNKACLASIDATISSLKKRNLPINPRMKKTKKSLEKQIL